MSAKVAYQAGSSLLVVAGGVVVLLDAEVPDTVACQVHNDLRAGVAVRDVLNLVASAGFARQVRGAATSDRDGWTVWSLVSLNVHVNGRAVAVPDALPLRVAAQPLGFGEPPQIPLLELTVAPEVPAAVPEHQRWLPLESGIAWCDALRLGLTSSGPTGEANPRAGATAKDLIGSATLPVFRSQLEPPRARPLEPSRRPDTANSPDARTAPADSAGVVDSSSKEGRPADATIVRSERTPLSSGPSVRALICQSDHPNPPESHSCRICGQALANTRVTWIPRPTLGVLRLVQGATDAPDLIVIDGNLVLGADPASPARSGLPRQIRVGSARSGVSARHLHIGLEGWHVLVSDLGSDTGTTIEIPGTEPTLLATRHPTLITPGTVIVLANSISYLFQVSK